MVAGTPRAMASGGTTLRLPTNAPAPTIASRPTRASCRTIEPTPIRALSSTVHPSRWARCPIVTSSPTVVGNTAVVWITAPSWIEHRSPMKMNPSSPRITAAGQTDVWAPRMTEPITTASGCT
jgi:hypothetical protein